MNVLILTVPSAEGADLVEMRDFVLESLELGVLILGLGVSWKIEQFPELGYVGVQTAPGDQAPPLPEPEVEPPEGDPPPGFTGKGAREKQQVLDALVQYRDRKGLGSLEALARPGGPTTQELRDALLRRKLPMETWRQIGAALAQDGEG